MIAMTVLRRPTWSLLSANWLLNQVAMLVAFDLQKSKVAHLMTSEVPGLKCKMSEMIDPRCGRCFRYITYT